MQGQSCCQGSSSSFEGKKVFLTKKSDNNQGSYYDVSICGKTMNLLKEQKGFVDAATANKNGLIAILINKLFTKFFSSPREVSEIDLSSVTKIEVNTVDMPFGGGKIKNTLLWNIPVNTANYENYFFVVALKENQLPSFVDAVKKVQPQVEYNQRT